MGKDDEVAIIMEHYHGTKRKTPLQLEALGDLYSEENYPTQKTMEDHAAALKLTYKQVKGWFAERRRKERRVVCSSSEKCFKASVRTNCTTVRGLAKDILQRDSSSKRMKIPSSSKFSHPQLLKPDRFKNNHTRLCSSNHLVGREDRRSSALQSNNSVVGSKNMKQTKKLNSLQDILPPDYILKKVFRKDGPPLGVEFDFLPPGAFRYCTDSRNSHPACQDNPRAPKRRKVSKSSISDPQACNKKSNPAKKYGIGKGLMTVWHATNPNAGSFPTGVNFTGREATGNSSVSKRLKSRKPSIREKRLQHQIHLSKQRRLGNKLQGKRKPSIKKRKVERDKDENQKNPHKAECKLALEGVRSQEYLNSLAILMDDEELELRELQEGPNPLTCSSHLATDGMHGCSLCKDLLARFPPHSVKMKQPFCMQPWDSSPELVKKLFKVFHFLYTHALIVDMCPFTLDEFAQAFHDKDSLLLGKIHVVLLNLLLSDVAMELSSRFLPLVSKNCRFLGFLHSVDHQEFVVQFWKRSLNPLTWTEILRQVLVAAGYGSKQSTLRREALNKEGNRMAKYGLRPGTLKGELFAILSEQGNNGLKVSELAKSFQIVKLYLASTADELELLICSTLSSDITLFEKISPSAYRLRIDPITKGAEDFQSDTEDSGSVDDDFKDSDTDSSGDDDSELDSATGNLSQIRHMAHHKRKNNMLTIYSEIDDSDPGEVWMLGLMEGEYSDLNVEEKLNALVALIDITSAGSSIRMEEPVRAITENIPDNHHHGSGAKIKRSSAKQHNFPTPFWGHVEHMYGIIKDIHTSPEFLPVDSFATVSKASGKDTSSNKRNAFRWPDGSKTKDAEAKEVGSDVHPMQSVYLGSDRRYNRYWLFLGPCSAKDPGHRRVYFESSEDGHWEVIDTEEALCALLSVLDSRGRREALLLASLEKREAFLCQAMSDEMATDSQIGQSTQSEICIISGDGSSPVSDVDNNLYLIETVNDSLPSSGAIVLEHEKKGEEQRQKWNRLQAFDAWIWNSFYSHLNAVKLSKMSYFDSLTRCESCHDLYWRDEKHCKKCHTTFELDFDLEERYAIHVATCREKEGTNVFPKHKVLSSQLQALKAAVHAIEAVMPEDALASAWTRSAHKLWVKRLRRTSSITELLQVLTDFVGAINEDWLRQCNVMLGSNTVLEEIMLFFPTMPQTTSAVALWLVKLDALIAPSLERIRSEKDTQKNYQS